MARMNTSLAVQYTTDFDVSIATPINFKIHADAPIPEGFYITRLGSNPCPVGVSIKTRAILATFVLSQQGAVGTFRYPVPLRFGEAGIFSLAQALSQLGAICLDLVGEEWTRVPNSQVPSGVPNYRSTPYTNIPGEPEKTSVSYQYDSDLAVQIGGQQTFSTNFETLPDELANVSQGCLINPTERQASSICGSSALGITPRRLNWYAEVADEATPDVVAGTIARQSIVGASPGLSLQECLLNIAPSIYCAGYEGESIRNIQNLVALTQ